MNPQRAGPGDAAALAARCAALLRGGVPAARSFELLAEEGGVGGRHVAALSGGERSGGERSGGEPNSDPALGEIARRVVLGEPIPSVLADAATPEWRTIAAAWRLAEETGAPLAPALERIASALRDIEQLRERRAVLLAGPRSTVRMVCALPPLALFLGGTLGFDPLPVLLSPLGIGLIVLGLALLIGGIAWATSMHRASESADRIAGVELELAWIVISAGAPPDGVRRRVVDCVDDLGVEWVSFDSFLADGALMTAVRSAQSTGVPLGPMLLESAQTAREKARTELEQAAERLGVRVLIPLALCVLPSFIVLGVLPVLISMLRDVGG